MDLGLKVDQVLEETKDIKIQKRLFYNTKPDILKTN